MASGDLLWNFRPLAGSAPATLAMGLKWIQDGSTPKKNTPVLTVAAGVARWMYWGFVMPDHYDGNGFTLSWKGGTDNTSVGTLQLNARLVKIADATALTSNLGLHSAAAALMVDTPPATPANKLNYSIGYTRSHAQGGSPVGGDAMALSITRETTDGNTGVLQCAEVVLRET